MDEALISLAAAEAVQSSAQTVYVPSAPAARTRSRIDSLRARLAAQPLLAPAIFLALWAVLAVSAVLLLYYTPAFIVSVNGVEQGNVSTLSVFHMAEHRAEAEASEILGYDYRFDTLVSFRKGLVKKDSLVTTAQLQEQLLSSVDEIVTGYSLSVDGTYVGTVADRSILDTALEALKARYVDDNTFQVSLSGQVSVAEGKVAKVNAAMTEEDMLAALTPLLSVCTVDREEYTEAIPSPVQETKDSTLYEGVTRTIQAGTDGQANVVADVTSVNGAEQSRDVLSYETVKEATPTIVAVGTKSRTLAAGSLIWPCSGSISSPFGYRYIFGHSSFHSGIDIDGDYGDSIVAAASGTVIFAGYSGTYGKLVKIDHGNGAVTFYAHCSRLLVSVGDQVSQGELIANVGASGRATGSHCHFEVQINGVAKNPLNYLQ